MSGGRTAITALLLAVALVVAVTAAAAPVAKRQQVVVNMKEQTGKGTFALLALTPGALSAHAGSYTWIVTSKKTGSVDGQGFDRYDAIVTYTGKRGTFVVREVSTLVAVALGQKVGTGTWRILRGTGAYERARGGGRLAAAARS
jgi:hypothetical protein